MKPLIVLLLTTFLALAELSYTEDGKEYYPAPGTWMQQLELNGIPEWRKKIILESLQVRSEQTWPKYIFGSADPNKGGFDCSGAMYHVLKRAGYTPARTSSDQYLWIKERGKLYQVSQKAKSLKDKAFKHLTPGDLVFWSGTYSPTDGRKIPVTHVGMYLGTIKGYPSPVMICASKGRYFDGKRRDGYGLYDFKLPSATSKSKIVAYGSLHKP